MFQHVGGIPARGPATCPHKLASSRRSIKVVARLDDTHVNPFRTRQRMNGPLIELRLQRQQAANHIAHGINVWYDSLKVFIDLDLAAVIRHDFNVLQAKIFRVSGPSVRPQQDIRLDSLAALQVQDDTIILAFDPFHRFVVTNDDSLIAKVIGKRVDNLIIEKLEQFRTSVDQVDLHPQVAKHRCILDTDHAGAVDAD